MITPVRNISFNKINKQPKINGGVVSNPPLDDYKKNSIYFKNTQISFGGYLSIKPKVSLEYGVENNFFRLPKVTNSDGFAEGKNLKVTITYDAFTSENVSTTIPFDLSCSYNTNGTYIDKLPSGDYITFNGQADGTVESLHHFPSESSGGSATISSAEVYLVNIKSADWGKALGGDYSATITFTAEVVVED